MSMKALIFTNEYPPHVYGGAGVHVDYLTRALAQQIDVEVRCFGDQRLDQGRLRVSGIGLDAGVLAGADPRLRSPLGAFARGISFAAEGVDADVIHCHTWYTHLGGVMAKLSSGRPLCVTAHSLEPRRAWKREQLGRGYELSSWIERIALEMADAVIAVSHGMRDDIVQLFTLDPQRVHVVYNGIDTAEYHPVTTTTALTRYGIDTAVPYVLFVGRITRQKGILHLVRAIPHLRDGVQVVLCAGAPDTDAIGEEMAAAVRAVQRQRRGVIWIPEMVDKPALIELYSHAAVFCCPSVYEPFGLINLEAMACGTAVVASAVGGIPEVVVDGETGLLVPLELRGSAPAATAISEWEPRDADRFAGDLAAALNRLLADAALRQRMGGAGRERVERNFSWSAVADETIRIYASLVGTGGPRGGRAGKVSGG